jgi:tRNA(adenine34) deaminase
MSPQKHLKRAEESKQSTNNAWGFCMATGKKKSKRRWVAGVTTESTHPPAGLFTKSAGTIARSLASKKVSPKGAGSGMRMLSYFINRAGRGLSPARRAELEKAKQMLSKRIQTGKTSERTKSSPNKAT